MRKSTLSRSPSAPPPSRPPQPRQAAFTLLELLIVISIIALLAGIVAVGMFGALGSTRDRGTETRFETLSIMMANHAQADQAAGGTTLRELPSVLRAIPTTGALYSTTDATDDSAENPATPALFAPPMSQIDEIVLDTNDHINAFARTQAVLRRLVAVPANSNLYSTLPNDVKTLDVPVGAVFNYSGSADPGPLDPPLVIDGHGGVILFVPAAGMSGLKFKGDGLGVRKTVLAADGGPFWVSAGADGAFGVRPGPDGIFWAVGDQSDDDDDDAAADDNVYSTQVVFK